MQHAHTLETFSTLAETDKQSERWTKKRVSNVILDALETTDLAGKFRTQETTESVVQRLRLCLNLWS